jgi:acyl carrier protein
MSLEQRVASLIIDQLGVSAEEISPEASFMDDLGADSLDIVELVMAIEEEFDIEIPDDHAARLEKIGDAIQYLQARVQT